MDKKSRIEAYAQEAFEKGLFHGTYILQENGEIISKGACGTRDPEDKLPMQEDTVFELASVSKHFTATCVMLLRKRGLIDLDEPMQKYLTELPDLYKTVTVRQTLNHTGGYPDYMEWVARTALAENDIPDTWAVMRFLRESDAKPLFVPGERMNYSNTGYCLLALLVERVSGVPFDDFLKQEIFIPCGMTSSQAYHRRRNGITIENYAYGKVLEDGKFVLPDESKGSNYVIPLDGMSGDGIVNTNIFDLFAWDRAQRNEVLLSKEEQMEMYTPGRLNDGSSCGYGFGWFPFEKEKMGFAVQHGGGWPGYNTIFVRCIDRDIMMAALTNRTGVDAMGRNTFFQGMMLIAIGEEPEPLLTLAERVIADPDRSGWEAFCGRYGDGYTVYLKEDQLWLKGDYREEEPFDIQLFPIGEKTFGCEMLGSEIVFEEGAVRFGIDRLPKVAD